MSTTHGSESRSQALVATGLGLPPNLAEIERAVRHFERWRHERKNDAPQQYGKPNGGQKRHIKKMILYAESVAREEP